MTPHPAKISSYNGELLPKCGTAFTRQSPYPEQFLRAPSPSNVRPDQCIGLGWERRFCASQL